MGAEAVTDLGSAGDIQELRAAKAGFIINTHPPLPDGRRQPATLHRVECRSMLESGTDYKLYAPSWAAAHDFLLSSGGAEFTAWYRCRLCQPSPPRRPAPIAIPESAAALIIAFAEPSAPNVPSVLHVGTCPALDRTPTARQQAFEDLEQAKRWARSNLGPEGERWHPCGVCRPGEEAQVERAVPEAAPRDEMSSEQLGRAEDAARIADLTVQLGEVQEAWESVVLENDSLRKETAQQHEELALLRAMLRDQRAGSTDAGATTGGVSGSSGPIADGLWYLSNWVREEFSPSDVQYLDLVNHLLGITSSDAMRERRGIALSNLGRDDEACAELRGIGTLTPPGRQALALSTVRSRSLPAQADILGEVDWSRAECYKALRDQSVRYGPADARVLLAQAAPKLTLAQRSELLSMHVERDVSDGDQRLLLALWERIDPADSASTVVKLVAEKASTEPRWWADALARVIEREPSNTRAIAAIPTVLALLDPSDAVDLAVRVDRALSGVTQVRFRVAAGGAIASRSPSGTVLSRVILMLYDAPTRLEVGGDADAARGARELLERIRPHVGEDERARIDEVLAASPLSPTVKRAVTPERAAPGPRYPQTVAQALEWGGQATEALTVLDRAVKQAQTWPSRDTGAIWNLMCALAPLASSWRTGEIPDLLAALKRLGHGFAEDQAAVSQDRYPGDYHCTDIDGAALRLGPHFKFGGRRLQLAIREDQRRIVVGYAGRHPKSVRSKG